MTDPQARGERVLRPDDEIDGCAGDFTREPTADEDIDGLVLFADVDPSDAYAVEFRKAEYEEIFDGS